MIVDTEIKNKSTAKLGMVVGKGTHKKGAMELKFLNEFKYNDKLTLKQVIETYEKALISQEQDFSNKITKLSREFESALKKAKTDLTKEMNDNIVKLIKEMQTL